MSLSNLIMPLWHAYCFFLSSASLTNVTRCVNCHCMLTGLSDRGLYHVVTAFPGLRRLVLKQNSAITDKGLQHVAAHCHQLRTLNLDHCVGMYN